MLPHAAATYTNARPKIYWVVRFDLVKSLTSFVTGTIYTLHGTALVNIGAKRARWGREIQGRSTSPGSVE
jgi:hypothetical protein